MVVTGSRGLRLLTLAGVIALTACGTGSFTRIPMSSFDAASHPPGNAIVYGSVAFTLTDKIFAGRKWPWWQWLEPGYRSRGELLTDFGLFGLQFA